MKTNQHNQAVELRGQGLTFLEIQKRLNVSKGSLSRWLSSVPYSPREATTVKRRLASIAAGQVLHKRKLERVQTIVETASKSILPIQKQALHLLGIMAYWTEGSKTLDNQVVFTNTDPDLIRLVYRWWVECCSVRRDRIRLHIRVHEDTAREEAENYWRDVTGIPVNQCYKTTIKESGSSGRRVRKIRFGIATIKVCDTDLHYRIKGWIEGIRSRALSP